MHCGQCGNELDLRYRLQDGSVQCRNCGAVMPAAYVQQYAQSYEQPYEQPYQQQPRQQSYQQPYQPSYQQWNPTPAPAPVRASASTGRRVIGVFSLVLGLLSLLGAIFGIYYWIANDIPGIFFITAVTSIVGIVLGGIGKGGCHVAGLVLSIIALVASVILFIVSGGIEILTNFGFSDLFESGSTVKRLMSDLSYYWY